MFLLLILFVFCSPLLLLQGQVPSIIRAIHKQLKEKSIKTRQGCFMLLTELVQVLPGALTDHVSAIVPGIQFSLGLVFKVSHESSRLCCELVQHVSFVISSRDKNSSSNMKIDTLSFINYMLCNHPPTVFHPHVKVLVPVRTPVSDLVFCKGFHGWRSNPTDHKLDSFSSTL